MTGRARPSRCLESLAQGEPALCGSPGLPCNGPTHWPGTFLWLAEKKSKTLSLPLFFVVLHSQLWSLFCQFAGPQVHRKVRQGLLPQMEGWSPGVLLSRSFLLQTLPLSAAWGSEQRERRKLVSALISQGLYQVIALCYRKEARREKNLFWGLRERAVSPNNSTSSVFLPGGPLEWTEAH